MACIVLLQRLFTRVKRAASLHRPYEYCFSSRLASSPVSEATIRKAFRANFTDYHIVPHGCRHFFSTQANESGLFRRDVIESFLAHSDKDKIRETYNEATYDKERRELAQWWSDQLDTMRDGAKVIPITGKSA